MTDQIETKQISWDDLEVAEEQEPRRFEGLGEEAAVIHQRLCGKIEYRAIGLVSCEPELELPRIEPETVDWRESTQLYYRDLICRGLSITPEQLEADERLTAYYQGVVNMAMQGREARMVGAGSMEAYIAGLDQDTTLDDFRNLRTAIRDLTSSVLASFDTFFKACSLLFEVRFLCVWDEFLWKMERKRMMKRHTTEVEFNDFVARWNARDLHGGQAAAIRNCNCAPELESQELLAGALDLGHLTTEEVQQLRTQWRAQWFTGEYGSIAYCTPSRTRLTGRL